MRLIVVHPRCLHASELNGLKWIYADADVEVKAAVESFMTSKHELITPREFQIFARSIREELIDSIDSCISCKNMNSWVLTPLHRNPFGNNVFLHLVWIAFLRVRMEEHATLVVVTDSLGLFKTLNTIFTVEKSVTTMNFYWFYRTYVAVLFHMTIIGINEIRNILLRMLLSRMILTKKYILHGVDSKVIIDTYLYDSDISASGCYSSPYMPGLTDWFKSQRIPVAILPTLYGVKLSGLIDLYKRMVNSKNIFLPFERLISWGDVFFGLSKVIYYLFIQNDTEDCDIAGDSKDLIYYSRYQSVVNGFQSLLFGVVPKRLLLLGYSPELLIDWFENQSMDRSLAINMAEYFPLVKHIAFRPYIACEMHTNLYTTKRQHAYGICPNETWVSGIAMVDILRCTDKDAIYKIMPALRYQHLWDSINQNVREPVDIKLLVLLPHSLSESMSILECIFDCGSDIHEYGIIEIKAHRNTPVTIIKELANKRWDTFHNVKWTADAVSGLLKSSSLVITSGTSTALEAACYGKLVVIVGQKAGFSMNPMVGVDPRIWTEVYTSSELRSLLSTWLLSPPLSFEERIEIGNEIRIKYFTPVNPDTMEGFRP